MSDVRLRMRPSSSGYEADSLAWGCGLNGTHPEDGQVRPLVARRERPRDTEWANRAGEGAVPCHPWDNSGTLRLHVPASSCSRGYTLNRQRLETNARELEAALQLVRKAAHSPELQADTGHGLVDIVTRYAQTFLLLQRYDEGLLTEPPGQRGGTLPTLAEARAALTRLKAELLARGEATDLFAQERGEAFAALLGNLDQSVLGEPAYPSVETKAAHLLYFIIKNHPFADGNKRSGAFLFVDFLKPSRMPMWNAPTAARGMTG
ncbi:MAG TPA: Fic family protein [Acidiferrobacteraceae bacterium]|nr:Fic family protein [Acidiferrobacteraceae bacterium]